uniref:Uncharacterized protein n=1 Tax=Populus trichocarpa TaxID=3694 RepID=U5GIC8_POPTR
MDPSVSTSENPDSNENNPQESESESNNSHSDALGKALSTMLATVIKDLDSKAQNTLNSKDKLNSAIDRLTRDFHDGFLHRDAFGQIEVLMDDGFGLIFLENIYQQRRKFRNQQRMLGGLSNLIF